MLEGNKMKVNGLAILFWSIAYSWAALIGAIICCFLTYRILPHPVDPSGADDFCEMIAMIVSAALGAVAGVVVCGFTYLIVRQRRDAHKKRSACAKSHPKETVGAR
jgi:zinc transporter ZupT